MYLHATTGNICLSTRNLHRAPLNSNVFTSTFQKKPTVLPHAISLECDFNYIMTAFDSQSCAVVFVGAEAGMREFNSGFHGADGRPGTVNQPLASLVCVITAPFSSRPCFCGVASERLMGWKKTWAQRSGSRSPLCLCLLWACRPRPPFLPSLPQSPLQPVQKTLRALNFFFFCEGDLWRTS